MAVVHYDELVSLSGGDLDATPPAPFYSIEKQDDELQWLQEAKQSVWNATRERANKQITMSALCRGRYYENQDAFLDFRDPRTQKNQRTTVVTLPEHQKYVNRLSNKLIKFQPGVQVGPYTNTYSDKEDARIAGKLSESLERSINLTKLLHRVTGRSFKFGEQFAVVTWNPEKGPIDPQWEADRKRFGDTAQTITKKGTGEVIRKYDPDRPTRAGDYEIRLPLPWNLLLDPKDEPQDVMWIMLVEQNVHYEELKRRWKRKKATVSEWIQGAKEGKTNIDSISTPQRQDHTTVYHFYHRSCAELPKGKYLAWVDGLILERGPNPMHGIEALDESEWGDLPIERMVDLELEGELHGFSSLYLVHNGIQQRNKILSMTHRNYLMAGHIKWLVHETANVTREALGNDGTIVKWSGNQPPTLAAYNPIPPGSLELWTQLGQSTDEFMNVHPVSSGNPPPGIKAGVAIRLLEEIEETNISDRIQELGDFKIALIRRLIAMSGRFCKKGVHLIRIVGEDKTDIIEEFDPERLTKRFNYTLDKVSKMARSPAARMQQIIDLVSVVKSETTQEQILDAMNLVQPEKLTDPGVAAVTLAEYENECCAQNKEMPAPREGERFIVHWNVHSAFYQSRAFQLMPEAAQERFRKHMLATEFLLSELAAVNPMCEQQVLSLPGFPSFYHLPPEQLAKRQALIQGPQAGPPPMGSEQLRAPEEMMMPQPQMTGAEVGGA